MMNAITKLLETIDEKAHTIRLGKCLETNKRMPQELSGVIKERLKNITNIKRSSSRHPGENKGFEDFISLSDQISICELDAKLEETGELSADEIELVMRVLSKLRKYRHYVEHCLKNKCLSMTYSTVHKAVESINNKTLGISLQHVFEVYGETNDLVASSLQLQHSEEDMQPSSDQLHPEQV